MNNTTHIKCSALFPGMLLLLATVGCGPTAGAWLYTLGLVPPQKVKAEYKLPEGAVLILVDDDMELIQPPLAGKRLVDELAKELNKHDIADRVTTNNEIDRIRRKEPGFEQRGVREIGQLANADTVIWLRTKQFYIDNDLEIASSPAKFAVELKVINARAQTREEVRLWPPPHQQGRHIEVAVSPHKVMACKTRAEVHEKLAKAMSDKIAKLFYDYKIDPYE